jgi:hypothetical protein
MTKHDSTDGVPEAQPVQCPECNGKGIAREAQGSAWPFPCPACNGSGTRGVTCPRRGDVSAGHAGGREGHEVKERGILFQGDMVRALLPGTKTQTRRALLVQPGPSCCIEEGTAGESPFVYSQLHGDGPGHEVLERRSPCACPYGQPGDRLWVREAFRTYAAYDAESMGDMQQRLSCTGDEMGRVAPIHYLADGHRRNWLATDALEGRYRHARFMPRWASRILLQIDAVRVERLQDISTKDCWAEGIPSSPDVDPRHEYEELWERINGEGSWDRNPWVWAVSFRRTEGGHGGA